MGNNLVRNCYLENGALFQMCDVKLDFQRDTTETFDPETYEQHFTIESHFVEKMNGNFTQYYEDGKYIQIQGSIVNEFSQGKWTYCMYPDESGNQQCYEANFENGIMVGMIRKIKNK